MLNTPEDKAVEQVPNLEHQVQAKVAQMSTLEAKIAQMQQVSNLRLTQTRDLLNKNNILSSQVNQLLASISESAVYTVTHSEAEAPVNLKYSEMNNLKDVKVLARSDNATLLYLINLGP